MNKIFFYRIKGCNVVWNTGKTEMSENEARKFVATIHGTKEIDFFECRIDGKIAK